MKVNNYALNLVNNLPSLPLCIEREHTPKHPIQLYSYSPAFGHEYGFKITGLRLGLGKLNKLDGRKGWDIQTLAKLVDVITWANVHNDEWVRRQSLLLLRDNSSDEIIGWANLAYVALNANDPVIKESMCDLLIRREIINRTCLSTVEA